MSYAGKLLSQMEDLMTKIETERKEIGWRQWLALARVVYWLLREKVKEQ